MGGWIVVSGETEHFDNQIRNFKKVFTVDGVPPLNVEITSYDKDLHIVLWSWSKPPVPDIVVSNEANGSEVMVLHGVITDLGRFGPAEDEQSVIGSTILELWNKYGRALIPELNGSFSYASVNAHDKSVTLFTDRFASRSVWFSKENNIWYVGNYPAALAAIRRTRPHLDAVGLWSLFATSRHVGAHGIYNEIKNMKAGQAATLHHGGICEISQWYRPRYYPQNGVSPREWGERIAQALDASAKRLCSASPEAQLFLSGGLDSRIVAAVLRGMVRTHTLCSQYNMETRIAAQVARKLHINHQTIVRTPHWYLDTFYPAALIGGGNYFTKHAHFIIPTQQICGSNANASFFTGDLLENFNKHNFHLSNETQFSFIPERIPDIFHKVLSYCHSNPIVLRRLFRQEVVERIYASWRQALVDTSKSILGTSEDSRDCLDTLCQWDNISYFPTNMMLKCIRPLSAERNLMFDNDIVELYLEIPADTRGAGTLHRWILWHLRKSLLLIPDANFWVPPIVPKSWQNLTKRIRPVIGNARRKIESMYHKGPSVKTEGSWDLLHERYRKDEKYIEFIEDCLSDPDTLPPEIFNSSEIEICWREFINGNLTRHYEIDALMSFGLLHKMIPTSGLEFA